MLIDYPVQSHSVTHCLMLLRLYLLMLIELLKSVLMIVWYILAHSRMKLCLFASYTYKREFIKVIRRQILVYLDVGGVSISRIRKLLVGWY